MKYFDRDEYEIELHEDRWEHIKYFHPEMESEINLIIESLNNPDLIQSGNKDEHLAIKKFEKTSITHNKYCIVVYKKFPDSNTGFIITSYFARRLSNKRKTIWEKK